MSWGKRLIWGGVGVALGCVAVFSAINYASSNQAYHLSGGPQIARADAALNDSMGNFSLAYTQLTGPSIDKPYVSTANARKELEQAGSSLDTAIEEVEEGARRTGANGFDKTTAEQALNVIRSSKKTISSILASLPPSESSYHGGREQALLVEANNSVNEALQMLSKAPSGASYKAWAVTAIGSGIAGLFAVLIGTVFYKGLAKWINEEDAKKSASS